MSNGYPGQNPQQGPGEVWYPSTGDNRPPPPSPPAPPAPASAPPMYVYPGQMPVPPQFGAPPGFQTPPPQPSGGGGTAKVLAALTGVMVIGLIGVIAYLISNEDNPQADPTTTENIASLSTDGPITTSNEIEEPVTVPTSTQAPQPTNGGNDLTATQKEAAAAARDRLGFRAESRARLIKYLTKDRDEGTFSEADANAGIDSLGVDWNRQASIRAGDYLDSSAFSRKGLISQLEYEEFTTEQATQAVDATNADWREMAKQYAVEFADSVSISRERLLRIMSDENDGFEKEQAEYGVDAANIDWNAEAVEAAREYMEFSTKDPTCEDVIDWLSGTYGEDFTPEQGEYGAKEAGAC